MMETLNKTWEDILWLTASIGELHQNLSAEYKYQVEGFFLADGPDQGHELLAQKFDDVFDEFVASNPTFMNNELPNLSQSK